MHERYLLQKVESLYVTDREEWDFLTSAVPVNHLAANESTLTHPVALGGITWRKTRRRPYIMYRNISRRKLHAGEKKSWRQNLRGIYIYKRVTFMERRGKHLVAGSGRRPLVAANLNGAAAGGTGVAEAPQTGHKKPAGSR